MSTRTFKVGDKVTIGHDPEIVTIIDLAEQRGNSPPYYTIRRKDGSTWQPSELVLEYAKIDIVQQPTYHIFEVVSPDKLERDVAIDNVTLKLSNHAALTIAHQILKALDDPRGDIAEFSLSFWVKNLTDEADIPF